MDSLGYDDIKGFLKTRYMGRNIIYMESTTSTNDIAKELGNMGAPEGTVVISEEQTKGRGRLGRGWVTSKGEAIAASILLRPDIEPKDAPSITPVLALSAVEALRELTGVEITIKWPNDLVLGGRKLCGILTEMNLEGQRIKYIVAGMGLNVNQREFHGDISEIATSLGKYLEQEYDRRIILSKILNRFEENYELFKIKGLKQFVKSIKEYSIILGKRITVKNIDGSLEGEAVDIDDEGCLIVKTKEGEIKRIFSGDVTARGLYDIHLNKV